MRTLLTNPAVDALDMTVEADCLMYPPMPGDTALLPAQADAIIAELREFLALITMYPSMEFVPTVEVDLGLHAFLLNNRRHEEVWRALGLKVIHVPNGKRSAGEEHWRQLCNRTNKLYGYDVFAGTAPANSYVYGVLLIPRG